MNYNTKKYISRRPPHRQQRFHKEARKPGGNTYMISWIPGVLIKIKFIFKQLKSHLFLIAELLQVD